MRKIYFLLSLFCCIFSSRVLGQSAGDYVGRNNMEWNGGTWSLSDGAGGYTGTTTTAPTSAKNVFILDGATVTVTTTAATCKNLTILSSAIFNPAAGVTVSGVLEMDGTLNAGASAAITINGNTNILGSWITNSNLTFKGDVLIGSGGALKGQGNNGASVQSVFFSGTSSTITVNGQLGGSATGGAGESLRLYTGATATVTTTTFTGTGKIFIDRFQANTTTAAQTVNIDVDMNINNNQINATGLSLQSGTGAKTLNLYAGRTIKFTNGNAGFHSLGNATQTGSTANTTAYGDMVYNIYGTLDVSVGHFAFYTSNSTNTINTTAALTLNISSTGVIKLGSNVRMAKLIATQTNTINVASGGTVDGSTSALGLTAANPATNGTGITDKVWFTLSPGAVFKRLISSGVATPMWIGPSNTNYNPVTVNPATTSVFTVGVASGINPASGLNTAKAVNVTWTVTPANPSATALTFGYNGNATGNGDANTSCDPTAAMKLWFYNGSSWSLLTPSAVTPLSGTQNDRTVTFAGVASFPTFALLNDFITSTNANLSSLTTSSGTLTPAFSSGVFNYSASVNSSSITVTPTTADAFSSLTVNGIALGSGSASAGIPLAVGANTITIVVTAQDGSTSQTYTLTVNRSNTYYSKATGDLSTLATYGNLTDGTGTSPTDFNGSGTNANYQLANRSAYTLTTNLSIGTTLDILTGATLDLGGNILNVNTINGTGKLSSTTISSLIVSGTVSSLSFVTGKEQLGNLTLGSSANVTLTAALNIASTGSVTLGNNATLNTGGFLTLKSTASGSAQITALGTGANISGNVTVERFLLDKRAWRLISSAVNSSQTINAAWQEGAGGTASNPVQGYGTLMIGSSTANGFDIAGNSASLLVYNGSTFNNAANTNIAVNSNPGYFVFSIGNRSVNPTIAGSHSSTILRSIGGLRTGVQSIPVNAAGYTLVGNPYAAAVDFSQVTRSSSIPNQFYAWDINLGTYGGYVLVNSSGGAYTSVPASPSGLNNIIPTGAAIFVQSDGNNPGMLTFDETSKATGAGNNTFSNFSAYTANHNQHNVRVNLTDIHSNLIDGVMVSFAKGNSNKVDASDALKLPNFYENISLIRSGKQLTLERRNEILTKDTIFIQLSGVETTSYRLELNLIDFNDPGIGAYLEDVYLHTRTKLDMNEVSSLFFSTNADTSSYKKRFQISFAPGEGITPLTKISRVGANVVAYPNPALKKQISLSFDGLTAGTYNITVINAFGQIMQRSNMNYDGSISNKLLNTDYNTGVYTINIQSAGFNQSIKVIIP